MCFYEIKETTTNVNASKMILVTSDYNTGAPPDQESRAL